MNEPGLALQGDWQCPFCGAALAVGRDCPCGAQAVNPALWLNPEAPLMCAPQTRDRDVKIHILAKYSNTLAPGMREMRQTRQ